MRAWEVGRSESRILKDIHNPLVQMSQLDLYSAGPQRLSDVAEASDVPWPSVSSACARLPTTSY